MFKKQVCAAMLLLVGVFAMTESAYAACGGTVRTWDADNGNDNWDEDANWSGDDRPNTAGEDVIIVAATQDTEMTESVTVGCMEVLSGLVTDVAGITVTITGDYFRNHTLNSVRMRRVTSWFDMAGTAPQTFENVDLIENLRISNDTSVTFTHPFTIDEILEFSPGWTGTLFINEDVYYRSNDVMVIPAGGTVVLGVGASLTVNHHIEVHGTLKLLAGAQLRIADGDNLDIQPTGTLIVEGAPGNPGVIQGSDFNDEYDFFMDGILNANYFKFVRIRPQGMIVNGLVQKLDNGTFDDAGNNDYYIRLNATASLPATFNNINFANGKNATNVRAFRATGYNGSTITVQNYSGSVATLENDPNDKVDWVSPAATNLTIVDFSNPPNNINTPETDQIGTFGFALSQPDTSTDITQVKLTLEGTASATDIDYIEIYRDGPGPDRDCLLNTGTDIDMVGQVQFTGSPPSYTLNIPAGDISTDSDFNRYCIHVDVTTTANAEDAKTIQIAINATDDVVNSQGYTFSESASPPISTSPPVEIRGDPVRKWQGDINTNWQTNGNWHGGRPDNNEACEIGIAQNICQLNVAQGSCASATFKTAGTLDFMVTTNEVAIYGNLDVQPGFIFQNSGIIAMRGTGSQTMQIEEEFPGDVDIINTGGGGNDFVSVSGDTLIGGDMTITSGTLQIPNNQSLTVRGNLTCLAGATLEIQDGGTLKLGNGSTLDIQLGCTLSMVGESGNNAIVTSDSGSSAYTVNVDGTIQARYYTFDHMGTAGISINAGATIDADDHLQDGTFKYPVNASTTMLSLARQVPTNTMNNMTFDSAGSAAGSITNINTTGAGAGTLTLDSYTGDLAGLSFDTDPTYLLAWLGATNTILLTQEATSPASVDAGSTYNMGRFGFQQSLAGASYSDTDLTSLRLTLTGTASANDIADVRVYYDQNCDGTGGTLLDNGTYSGNPASRTFTFGAGQATIEADLTSPPKRCIYVEYVIAAGATDSNTLGVQIAQEAHVVNSQSYAINSSTQPPINSGTPASIVGQSLTLWQGGVDSDWFDPLNWSAGLPDDTKSCSIDSATNNPQIDGQAGAQIATCKSIQIGNGTLTLLNATTAVLEIYGSFDNTGTIVQNDGVIRFQDDGGTSSNQGINTTSINALTFNKTAGGEVFVNTNNLTIGTLTFPGAANFDFRIPNGKTLTLTNSVAVDGATFDIDPGGTLEMSNGTTFTVNAGGKLNMVGTSGNLSTMTSTGGAASYNVVVNGEIAARYFNFDHLATTGVSIESGATINTTDPLQNGEFTYPVNSSTTMLALKRHVPGGSINSIKFDLAGSAAGSITNIDTTGASAGTLNINSFLGDLGGPTFTTDPSYTVSWNGAVNTIDLTQEATSPGGVNAGSTYVMGRFGFQQTLPGASYADTDLTSLKVSVTGTATAADVDAVRIFYDADCDSAGGTQIGEGDLSGSPPSRTFNLTAGQATIESHATTPPLRCIYVEYDIASGAINARTAGVEIAANSHVTNDQGYELADATPAPVNLGTPATITGSSVTTWTGSTDSAWTDPSNWSAGVPTTTTNCIIDNVTNDPVISTGAVSCKQATLNSGAVLTLNGASDSLEVHGNLVNTGSIAFNSGAIVMAGGSGNNTIVSNSVLDNLGFNKTGGTVSIVGTVVQVANIDFATNDSTVELLVPNNKTLRVTSSINIGSGSNLKTLSIGPGGTLEMADATTLTANANGKLQMVGTNGNPAVMTSNAGSSDYNVIINTGEIEARYYTFDHLGTAGVSIESGATIDGTNHLQDCTFTHPVNNTSTLLFLKRQVPTNTMDNCHFDLDGSGATGTTNINTTGAAAGTLTLDSYTGDLSGDSFSVGPTYLLSWTGALNTIDLTQEATTPGTLNAGSTYNMGRFGFQQALAGASYNDADYTSIKLQVFGTAVASDIDALRIYSDSDCNGTAGTLIGTSGVGGNPLSATFPLGAGDLRVEADASTPPQRCMYVEVDVSPGAVNNNTIGIRINSAGDIVNDQTYAVSAGTPPPITLGAAGTIVGATTTNWTGATDSDWFDPNNWSAGVPTDSTSCNISNVANDPNIDGNGGLDIARCRNFNISNGIVTLLNGTTAVLEIHGNYVNTGTLTQNNGTLRVQDGGLGTAQTLQSTSTLSALTFDKTAGGSVRINSSLSINNLTIPGASSFELTVPSAVTLTMPNGLSIPAATVNVESGGMLQISSGQTLLVNGGTLRTSGVNDTAAQNLGNKGTIQATGGSGTWTFNATSGTLNLTGFLIKHMDANGMNVSGTTSIANLDGGQFTNIASTTSRVIQLNTSGSVPATATNIGWMWDGPNNSQTSSCCSPGTGDAYYLVYAPNCGSATITFDQWFGDFTETASAVNTEDKIHDADDGGPTCQISIAAGASPVSLTKLEATPYNAAVSLDWETASEINHAGFNVYRSVSPATGYVQVNGGLIRNTFTSTSHRGVYRYVDKDVTNDITYFYKIQDVAFNGDKIMHGPVYVTPKADLGDPPDDAEDTNSGESDNGGETGNDPTHQDLVNEGLVDLGNGVHIIAQSDSALRVEIVPPPASWQASSWDGSYETLTVPGYAKMTTANEPELVERTVLIAVDSHRSEVSVSASQVSESAAAAHKLQPAPAWDPDDFGVLQPSYALDPVAYGTGGFSPASYYKVTPDLVDVAGKKYIELTIFPWVYDAVSEQAKGATKITLDFSLDGESAWTVAPPENQVNIHPANVSGSLRIKYEKPGMYELLYDDIFDAGLDGPLSGVPVNDLRLYYRGEEIAILVESGDSPFNSGDRILFYANHHSGFEDVYDEVVLSTIDVYQSGMPAARMAAIDGNPAGFEATDEEGTSAFSRAEEDWGAVFDLPMGDMIDHFYWMRIFAARGGPTNPPPPESYADISLEMPGVIQDAESDVLMMVHVNARSALTTNATHHLGIYINNYPYLLDERSFSEDGPQTLIFRIPHTYFFSGTNTVRLRALGDMVPVGDWDIFDIDKVEVFYRSERMAVDGVATVYNNQPDVKLVIDSFVTNDIQIFDITDTRNTAQIINPTIGLDGSAVTYQAEFAAHWDDSGDQLSGYQLLAIEEGSYLKPAKISMSSGSDFALKDALAADMIVIGSIELLSAAEGLISLREQEGLRVVAAPLEQIYIEFSGGVQSSQAIKAFIQHAQIHWEDPSPKYLLILGDATYDPRDRYGYGVDPNTMPMPLERGLYMDFGNDNWFVSNPANHIPSMAVGRIPSSNPADIKAYAEKVIRYEEGETAPDQLGATQTVFISDQDNFYEGFSDQNQTLANSLRSARSAFQTVEVSRAEVADDVAANAQIVEKFENGPLLVTYLGHGAEDRWASEQFFINAHANELTNVKLPIVAALNCLNSRFYDADPNYLSLGESLILNPEGGAIAFWGSTSMTIPPVQVALANAFMSEIAGATLQEYHAVRMGDIALRAKQVLGDTPSTRDTLRSWTLFGDPTMKLPQTAFTERSAPVVIPEDPPKVEPPPVVEKRPQVPEAVVEETSTITEEPEAPVKTKFKSKSKKKGLRCGVISEHENVSPIPLGILLLLPILVFGLGRLRSILRTH